MSIKLEEFDNKPIPEMIKDKKKQISSSIKKNYNTTVWSPSFGHLNNKIVFYDKDNKKLYAMKLMDTFDLDKKNIHINNLISTYNKQKYFNRELFDKILKMDKFIINEDDIKPYEKIYKEYNDIKEREGRTTIIEPKKEENTWFEKEIEEEENVELVEKTDIKQRLEELLHNTVLVPLNQSIGNITSEIDIIKKQYENNGNIYKSAINKMDLENDIIQLGLKKQELDNLNQLNDTGEHVNLDLSIQQIKHIQNDKTLNDDEKIYQIRKFIKSKLFEMENQIKNPNKKSKLKSQSKKQQLDELKKFLKKK